MSLDRFSQEESAYLAQVSVQLSEESTQGTTNT